MVGPNGRYRLAGEINGFGQLLTLDQPLHFTNALFEQVLFFFPALLIPVRGFKQLENFWIARKLLVRGSQKVDTFLVLRIGAQDSTAFQYRIPLLPLSAPESFVLNMFELIASCGVVGLD